MKGTKFVLFELAHSLPLPDERRKELMAHIAEEFGVEDGDHPLLQELRYPEDREHYLTLREPVRTRQEREYLADAIELSERRREREAQTTASAEAS